MHGHTNVKLQSSSAPTGVAEIELCTSRKEVYIYIYIYMKVK